MNDKYKLVYVLKYLKSEYKYIKVKNNESYIDSLYLTVDDRYLFKAMPSLYMNLLVPYKLYKNCDIDNNYVYSFSVNPLEHEQSYGYLNYNIYNSKQLVLNTLNKSIYINTATTSYVLLKYISGQVSLYSNII